MDESIEITEPMLKAGMKVMSSEYGNTFDPQENDARHFLTRVFQAMQKARHQSLDPISVETGSKS